MVSILLRRQRPEQEADVCVCVKPLLKQILESSMGKILAELMSLITNHLSRTKDWRALEYPHVDYSGFELGIFIRDPLPFSLLA